MIQILESANNNFKDTIHNYLNIKKNMFIMNKNTASLSRDFHRKTKGKMGRKVFEEIMVKIFSNINLYT